MVYLHRESFQNEIKLSFCKMKKIAYVIVQNRGTQACTHSKLPRFIFFFNLDIIQNSQVQSEVAPCSPGTLSGLPLAKCYFSFLH